MTRTEAGARKQLTNELAGLRPQVAQIEASETGHEPMDEALRESEEICNRLADNVSEAIVVIQRGRVKYFNLKTVALTGYSREELASKPFVELVHPDDREMVVKRHLKRLKGEGVPNVYQFRLLSKNGDAVWVEVNAVLITRGGRPAVLSLLNDASERKRVETALKESEERYRRLLNEINDGFFVADASGTVTFANRVYALDHGFEGPEEVIGRNITEFMLPESRQRMIKYFEQVIETGKFPEVLEKPFVRKDGSIGYFELKPNPIKDNGKVVGMSAVVRDITRRKRAQQELRQSEEKFRALYRSISVPNYLWRRRGDDFVLVNYSDVAEATTAGRVVGLLGKEASKVYESTPGIVEDLLQCFAQKASITRDGFYEFEKLEQSGYFILRYSFVPPDMVALVTVDVNERKQAEIALKEYSEQLEEMVERRTKELRQTQEELLRKEKLATLGQLAAGVGHELRNPLGALKNAAYFLNMVLEAPDAEVKESLQIIDKEINAAEHIISSLLDFARPQPPVRQKVNVNYVVEETLSLTPVPRNVRVMSQLAPSLPAVQADPVQLGQVFANIVLNAVQAMPEGGRLTVRSEVQQPNWVAISFSDSGLGVPEENMGRIFEPLFTSKAKGIGLGLAITKTLVEAHGGSIKVESEGGKGSTFTIKLPSS